jgi:hypothetical protein
MMGHTAKIIHELKTDPKWKGLCVCVCVYTRRRTWLWL